MQFIIVGQGLVGSLLSIQLIENGHTVHVLDNGHLNSASHVAAGILNPLTGPRLSRTWPSQAHLDTSLAFYHTIESILNTLLVIPLTLHKHINTVQEIEAYTQKKSQPEYQELFKTPSPTHHNTFHIPIYRINTQALLKKTKDYLIRHNAYIQTQFNHNSLKITATSVKWKHITADAIIFCEGYKGAENPLFSHLKFKNAKGELIHFTCDSLPPDVLFNHGKWSCPLNKTSHLYGSTAYWDFTTQCPQYATTHPLMQSLKHWIGRPYQITQVTAGIRPIMANRQPIAETHPQFDNVHIINGLGSHGTYMAPHLLSRMTSRFTRLNRP
jgi:glycine oxidase